MKLTSNGHLKFLPMDVDADIHEGKRTRSRSLAQAVGRWMKRDGTLVRTSGNVRYISADTPLAPEEGDRLVEANGNVWLYEGDSWSRLNADVRVVGATPAIETEPEAGAPSMTKDIPVEAEVGDLMVAIIMARSAIGITSTGPSPWETAIEATSPASAGLAQTVGVSTKLVEPEDIGGTATATQAEELRFDFHLLVLRSSTGAIDITDMATLGYGDVRSAADPGQHGVPAVRGERPGLGLAVVATHCVYTLTPNLWSAPDEWRFATAQSGMRARTQVMHRNIMGGWPSGLANTEEPFIAIHANNTTNHDGSSVALMFEAANQGE